MYTLHCSLMVARIPKNNTQGIQESIFGNLVSALCRMKVILKSSQAMGLLYFISFLNYLDQDNI